MKLTRSWRSSFLATFTFFLISGLYTAIELPPNILTIFMHGTSVSPSPKYIMWGNGMRLLSSAWLSFTFLLSLMLSIPLLILKRN